MHVESVMRLLARGRMIRVTVELDGEDLIITGPRSAGSFVHEVQKQKADVVAYLQAQGCGALHIRPEQWLHKSGKAFCPRCDRFMGYVVSAVEVPQERIQHAN